MAVKIYGESYNICKIAGAPCPADEVGCFDSDCVIELSDGTLLRVSYEKEDLNVWTIQVLKSGATPYQLIPREAKSEGKRSDIFSSQADYKEHWVVDRGAVLSESVQLRPCRELVGTMIFTEELPFFQDELVGENLSQSRKQECRGFAIGLNSPWTAEDVEYCLSPTDTGWKCTYAVTGRDFVTAYLYSNGKTPEDALAANKKLFSEIQTKWNPTGDTI